VSALHGPGPNPRPSAAGCGAPVCEALPETAVDGGREYPSVCAVLASAPLAAAVAASSAEGSATDLFAVMASSAKV